MEKEIVKIYAKREKAHKELLECDKQIDDLLKTLFRKTKKNNEEIVVPIYYAMVDGEKRIDIDSTREMFEHTLDQVVMGE